MTFLGSLCGKYHHLSDAYPCGSEVHVRTGAGTGAEGAEIGGRIAVASLFIDLAGDIPFHTTSEIAVRKQN